MSSIIHIKSLSKAYSDKQILAGIDLSINKNECVAILGPSGAGKTTLLKCIIGLETIADSNSIMIDGGSREQYLQRHKISFVPQQYANFPWMTVAQNIGYGIRDLQKSTAEKAALVDWLIHSVALKESHQLYPNQLSGGMQQRVAIARALAQDTDILAMDEPLGALDFKNREDLQLLLKQINKTILFVTHDVEEAIFVADRIVILSPIPSKVVQIEISPFRRIMDSACKYDVDFIKLRACLQAEIKKVIAQKNHAI